MLEPVFEGRKPKNFISYPNWKSNIWLSERTCYYFLFLSYCRYRNPDILAKKIMVEMIILHILDNLKHNDQKKWMNWILGLDFVGRLPINYLLNTYNFNLVNSDT